MYVIYIVIHIYLEKCIFSYNIYLYMFSLYIFICCAQLIQSCLTICNPMDCSRPGSSVQGILQTKILEWVAMPSSRGSSQPEMEPESLKSPALAGGSLPAVPPRKPYLSIYPCYLLLVPLQRELASY